MKERFSSPLQAAEASYLQGDKIFMKTLQKIDTKLRLLWAERNESTFHKPFTSPRNRIFESSAPQDERSAPFIRVHRKEDKVC